MDKSLIKHVTNILVLANKKVKKSPLLADETGATNIKGDKTLAMDKKLEDAVIGYIKLNSIPADIFSEEIGMVRFHPNPKYLLVFDPLDGSTNYKLGKNLLPYGLLICCYKGLSPKLKDVVVSGMMEVTTNQGVIFDGKQTRALNGKKVNLNKSWFINQSTPVYFDLYYKKAYDAFAPLAQKYSWWV